MDIRPRQPAPAPAEVAASQRIEPLSIKSKTGKTKRRITKRGLVVALFALLLIASVGYNFYQSLQIQDYRKNPTKAAQEEQARITGLIRKHYQIPTYATTEGDKQVTKEDTPQIATITDITKMKDQTFFDKAQNGDFIVVFPNTRLALIYREKTDQIVNSGPVAVDASQQASKLNVKIYGAPVDRDAAESKINAAFPGSANITKLDASSKVTATVVVDVSGKNAVVAEQLASKLKNAAVGSVPTGQPAPTDTEIAIYAVGQ